MLACEEVVVDDVLGAPARHRLTVSDYHRMGEAGILGTERVELIDGELIDMAPIGAGHAGTVRGLNRVLTAACMGRAIVDVQNPVRLDGFSEPQPDLAVLRLRADDYRGAHPGPADVLLVVEVADSSLRFDREVKLPMYARAGIGEVWIVDLGARVVESDAGLVDGGYATVRRHGSEATVALTLSPDIEVMLGDVFG